jgi:glutamate synthase domain-containing protein 1/glutamate synthase domain-containing protein 3
MDKNTLINNLIKSRDSLKPKGDFNIIRDEIAEGGCGVIGLASNVQISAKHMLQALKQMRNRGNSKGGGIAAVGLNPKEFGVTKEILENDYLIAIAYLDITVREELEREFIFAPFEIDNIREQPQLDNYQEIDTLDVPPPTVIEYFVRVKKEVFESFSLSNELLHANKRRIEDEIVYQNTYRLNTTFYKSTGKKQAFILSHGKNLLVLKMVGYGDDVIRYYKLDNLHAHVWIGHHRYPTKGRVWHPGGAHPFIGLNEALVHNGDFANHASISEYLSQRNIYPLFLTDTEVAVQVFDLLHRIYDYPLEYVIEAMAPTTERDFTQLNPEKQHIYKMLQDTHMHCSPDGPWFFLIAQSDTNNDGKSVYRLTGITDTSMLRPQVFAWQENAGLNGESVAIGFAASEKQGIDAALESLSQEDNRFWSRADKYWNARGGSHTDGGAFLFTVRTDSSNHPSLTLQDKFGIPVAVPTNTTPYQTARSIPLKGKVEIPHTTTKEIYSWFTNQLKEWSYQDVINFLEETKMLRAKYGSWKIPIDLVTLLMDRRYDTFKLRRSSLLSLYDETLEDIFSLIAKNLDQEYKVVSYGDQLPYPDYPQQTVILDASGYPPEGDESVAREIHRLVKLGFRRLIIKATKGHRFIGAGFGSSTNDIQINVYGSPGDYLASGIDGLEINVHNNGQDQLAQIMKSGKLVVNGDVGQTFMYGAKGGEAYILGNAAGRPLINAVGKPRVVINGTCLDYLAESFMAGDPNNGGGFVILNGISFDENNQIIDLETPYPGGNLFSLASGGAIFLRDPENKVTIDQLNGGEFTPFTEMDWQLIKPYLVENAKLFDISIDRLLTYSRNISAPENIYRKITPSSVRAMQAEESWVVQKDQ